MKILLLFILLASCSQLSYLPPKPETAEMIDKSALNRPLNLSEVWYSLYRAGKDARTRSQHQVACEKFGRLVSFAEFPLHDLAKLYQLETCSYTGNAYPAEALAELESQMASGFKSEFHEVAYALAKRFGDPKARAQTALNLAREKTLRAEKEALFKEAWELAPAGDLKDEAAKSLFKYAPRFNPNPEYDDYPDLARDYERSREFSEASKWYQRILKEDEKKDFNRWLSAAKRYRQLFKNQRDKAGYLRETNALKTKLEKMVKKKRNDEVINALAEIMIDEARALWTENRRTDGSLVLERALEFLPNMSKDNRALIFWIRGMMELEAKDHNGAKRFFRMSLQEEASDKKVLQDATWNLAWTLYLDNENDAFIALVDETLEKLGDDMREKLEFWKGKAYYRAGRIELAVKTWQELYERAPFNYYGLMAHAQAGGSFAPIAASLSDAPVSSEAEWLASLNEWDLCRQYLDDWRRQKHLDSTKEKWLATFIRCRHASGAIRVYYSHGKSGSSEFMRENLAALYPLSFKQFVFGAADRFKTDPYLLQSIIRQESAFNPEARSPADAFGLMQLIPELAKRLARQQRVSYKDFNDLYDPKVNATLGSAYVRELMQKMNGRMVGVIGAYNAGTGPIFNWYKNRNRKDVFEFIEGIAYEETRNYVKLVLRNWIIYQQLERNAEFALDLKDLH